MKNQLAEIANYAQRGMLATISAECPGTPPAALFDGLVEYCCTLIGKPREDIEVPAVDTRFDRLERDQDSN